MVHGNKHRSAIADQLLSSLRFRVMSSSTHSHSGKQKLRVTESRNELTTDIDVVDAKGIIRVLRNCDAQIFSGYREYENIFEIPDTSKVIGVIMRVLKSGGAVFISGAGTSGRLAHFVCSNFNRYLASQSRKPRFFHLIAGGEAALLKSQESAEDASAAAVGDFERARVIADVPAGAESLLIGVTCGFSATYVGAQIEHVLGKLSESEGWSAVALGFNPVELVREVHVAGWNITFKQVLQQLSAHKNGYILSPSVGPEGITGSTRMKGGSGTKIMLESLLISAFTLLTGSAEDEATKTRTFNQIVLNYHSTMEQTYLSCLQDDNLAQIIEKSGQSLRKQKRVMYLSDDTVFGTLAVVDASECPPTYGASFEDVRAFIVGGWETLMNNVAFQNPTPGVNADSPLLKSMHMDHFEKNTLPSLTKDDTIIVFFHNYDFNKLADFSNRLLNIFDYAHRLGVCLCSVHICDKQTMKNDVNNKMANLLSDTYKFFANVTIPLPYYTSLGVKNDGISTITPYRELACKLVLNAVSTGAHVLKGATVSNLMVSLKISNAKLFDRATHLLQRLVGEDQLDLDVARTWILKAIYGNKTQSTIIADHINEAMAVEVPVVPLAYLMIMAGVSRTEAIEALKVKSARKIILEHQK